MKKKAQLSIRIDEHTAMLLNELASLTGRNISVLSRALITKGLNDMLDNEGYINVSVKERSNKG